MQAGRRLGIPFRKCAVFMAIPMLLFTLCACASPQKEPEKAKAPPGGVRLTGAGATFPSLLYNKWFQVYQKDHGDTVIAYDAVGSGEGIRRFMGRGVKEDELADAALICLMHQLDAHHQVVVEKFCRMFAVRTNATDMRGQMNNNHILWVYAFQSIIVHAAKIAWIN